MMEIIFNASDQQLSLGVLVVKNYNTFLRTYEYYAGHTLAVALKHYQSWDELRAQKAAPKILEALKGFDLSEKASPQFCPQLPHRNAHSNHSISQYQTKKTI